jgi:hypothetical protein
MIFPPPLREAYRKIASAHLKWTADGVVVGGSGLQL